MVLCQNVHVALKGLNNTGAIVLATLYVGASPYASLLAHLSCLGWGFSLILFV